MKENPRGKGRILRQMFDIKPVLQDGNLDFKKIQGVSPVLDLKQISLLKNGSVEPVSISIASNPALKEVSRKERKIHKEKSAQKPEIYIKPRVPRVIFGNGYAAKDESADKISEPEMPRVILSKESIAEELERFNQEDSILKEKVLSLEDNSAKAKTGNIEAAPRSFGRKNKKPFFRKIKRVPDFILGLKKATAYEDGFDSFFLDLSADSLVKRVGIRIPSLKLPSFEFSKLLMPRVSAWNMEQPLLFRIPRGFGKSISVFIVVALVILSSVPFLSFAKKGVAVKDKIFESSLSGYDNLLSAENAVKSFDFSFASEKFQMSYQDFKEAGDLAGAVGESMPPLLGKVPLISLFSSGYHLIKTGEHLSRSGNYLAKAIESFMSADISADSLIKEGKGNKGDVSLASVVSNSLDNLRIASIEIKRARGELEKVSADNLDESIRGKVDNLKKTLPVVDATLTNALGFSNVLLDLIGGERERAYLLLFQNSSELRATGGFAGTYGIIKLDRGDVEKIFIDGVFNPDGQLSVNVIPPEPIRKISTAWSMHDANWYPDFPLSAKKIAWFYEKSGGETVDGVIAINQTVIEKLLEITGPIEMPEYSVTLSSANFTSAVQYQVEYGYDKELNQPKKILADFMPVLMGRLSSLDSDQWREVLLLMKDVLNQKEIQIYLTNPEEQRLIRSYGWTGEILNTEKDYLAVISSNINGFKTDAVIEGRIVKKAEIQQDGSIINTVSIIKTHNGGNTSYDFWNKVNASYLRVYVPLGSELLEVSGHTRETVKDPIDYEKSGFQKDPDVSKIESTTVVDESSKTQIFEESGKTVFGNWVYVSPGRTRTVTYRYKLPFKLNTSKPSDSFSVLIQKQSGSRDLTLENSIEFPQDWNIVWKHPEAFDSVPGRLNSVENFNDDKFFGVVFKF